MRPFWLPHDRETWPWRIGKLKVPIQLRSWHGHDANPEFTYRDVPAGAIVKIVMVSRMGHVGITDNLEAETGYQACVLLEELEPLTEPATNSNPAPILQVKE